MAGTTTLTWTKTDIARVFEKCTADIYMLAVRTGGMTEEKAIETMHDVQIMAEEACLVEMHIQLQDRNGQVIKAQKYTPIGQSDKDNRPGGNSWPRIESGRLRVIVRVEGSGWEEANRRTGGRWSASEASLDYTSMTRGGERTFSHGAFGMERVTYTQV